MHTLGCSMRTKELIKSEILRSFGGGHHVALIVVERIADFVLKTAYLIPLIIYL